MSFRSAIAADFDAMHVSGPRLRTWLRPGLRMLVQLRAAEAVAARVPRLRPVMHIVTQALQARHSCDIPLGTLEPGVILPHPFGVLVHETARVGAGTRLFHLVSLAPDQEGRAATVANDCTIYTGCVTYGPISIGEGATLGAMSVVGIDVPAGATVRPPRVTVVEPS